MSKLRAFLTQIHKRRGFADPAADFSRNRGLGEMKKCDPDPLGATARRNIEENALQVAVVAQGTESRPRPKGSFIIMKQCF